jgi:hypothetical protein
MTVQIKGSAIHYVRTTYSEINDKTTENSRAWTEVQERATMGIL